MNDRTRFSLLPMVLLTALAAGGANAQELSLRGDFTGNWYDPAQSGHGLQLEVIDPRTAVLTWYTFDAQGDTIWLFGVGDVEGDRIRAELHLFQGGAFPPDFDPDAVAGELWGEVVLTFADCDSGEMSWDPVLPGFTPGAMPLVRLTGLQDLRCGQAEQFEQAVEFSLDAGPGRWEALFADFSEANVIDEEAGWTELPEPLSTRRGFMLSGQNASDDLAMFIKHPVGGLQPATEYQVELEMTFATEIPRDCAGIGGSPGESVFINLGAAGSEPVVIEENGEFRLNIDKGNQSRNGSDGLVVGDMTNFQEECTDENVWQLKTVSTAGRDFSATTDADGTLWVYGGSDSGFEGRTTFFITDFRARITP